MEFNDENYLIHYGIMGQKWGVRRFQNEDGTLTEAGKARYSKEEIKAENKKAFELGKNATILGNSLYTSEHRTKKYEKRAEKHQNNERLQKKAEASRKTTESIKKDYEAAEKAAKEHAQYLIDHYGAKNVKNIKYDKNGRITGERVMTSAEIVESILATAGSVALAGAFMPFTVIYTPKGGVERGKDIEKARYIENYKLLNKK